MTKLAISCKEEGVSKFLRYKVGLGHPATLETVSFEEATLFDDPDLVERIIRDFRFAEPPHVEIVNVAYVRSVGSREDKYKTFLGMARERMIPSPICGEVKREKVPGMGDIGYPVYLFSKLWHINNPEHNKLEYDLTYKKIVCDWNEFKESKHDDPNESLYECILSFFRSKDKVDSHDI